MANEVLDGVQIIVNRMKSNPEEFFGDNNKWKWVFKETLREVLNEIQVSERGGLADTLADARITTSLRFQLMGDRNVTDINYSIDTVNGIVYLIGIAQDQAELDRVLNYARNISGVKQVVNHVVLKNDPRR